MEISLRILPLPVTGRWPAGQLTGETSTRVLAPAAPTPTQAVGVVQETAMSVPPAAGVGVVASRHDLPFQVMAIVANGPLPVLPVDE